MSIPVFVTGFVLTISGNVYSTFTILSLFGFCPIEASPTRLVDPCPILGSRTTLIAADTLSIKLSQIDITVLILVIVPVFGFKYVCNVERNSSTELSKKFKSVSPDDKRVNID